LRGQLDTVKIQDLSDDPRHIPTLAQWHHRQWQFLNPRSTIETRMETLESHLDPNPIPSTYVAVADGRLLGSASLVQHDVDSRLALSPWLASVFVAPRHRKFGIGSGLVRHVVAAAREQGIERIYLFTPDKQRFYVNLGWQVLEHLEYRGHPVTIMEIETGAAASN
jgi:N-acetylglutamate synthase-like GNAT family acetyltransferase